ncbi:MAG: transcriptional repressor LexA [Candidatus Paceibacterota bacterium]
MSKKELKEKELEAFRYIRNAIVHGGFSPSVRNLRDELGYKSPRSALLLLNSLIERGWIKRNSQGDLLVRKDLEEQEDHARTVELPLVGAVSCGSPILAEENIEAYIPVSRSIVSSGGNYFLLRATGDSMDQAGIQNGDILLVRQQNHASNGEKIVALIDDEATVKEFSKNNGFVVLKPRSSNKEHKPIIVSNNFSIQGVIVATLPDLT